MKKFFSAAKHMLPALAVIIVLLVCAAMPELGVIPDRLTSEVEAGETDEAEDADSTEQAVGDYVDGTYVGSATGYGGLITVQVTVEDSQMTEIEVLDHSGETDSFYNRAVAVIDSILLAQTWEVDAISGATYSSNGIKNAVKNAVTGEETESETAAESGDDDALEEVEYEDPDGYTDGIYYGSATGFGGTITVAVTIEDGVITSIEIVSAPGETESYFSQALAVIDAILSAQSPNVDAISGATYSSNGIINAVKDALSQAVSSSSAAALSSFAGSSSSSDDSSASGSTVSDTSALPNYGYTDGTYTGSGIGYGGEVVLSVTIEGGQIVDIEVVSAEGETYAYWNQAIALLDLIIEAQTTDGIDAVSGATFSSNGILDAVAEALAQAAPSDDEEDNDSTGSGDADDGSDGGSSEDGSTGSDDTEDETSSVPNYGYVDGTYTGTGIGYGGEIVLSVTIEGGLIVDIEVVSADGETYAYWMQAVTLIDLILETQTADGVDVVAGATYSSNGIISAIQDALEQAAPSDDEEDDDGTGSGDADDGSDSGSSEDGSTGSDDAEDETSSAPNYGYVDGTYTGTGIGYGGEIVLIVTIEGGLIVDIEVVSADGETYAYWMQAVTLIDLILETQTADGVDVVAGATYSSNGIISAIQDALEQAAPSDDEEDNDGADSGDADDGSDGGSSEDGSTGSDDTEDETSSVVNYGYVDGTYTGTGTGYGGEIVLIVTIEGGLIVDIEVVSADGETYVYWMQAVTLIDLILETQTADGVDVVAGATYSSNGIISAIQDALEQAAPSDDEEDDDSAGSGDADDGSDSGSSEDGSTGSDDAEDETSSVVNYGYVDGTYTGTGIGYGGEIVLSVTIEGGLIVDIEVVSADGETYAYWMQAVTLIDLILETQTADGVDVVAGATYSSNGIISAIQDALEQAVPSDDEEDNDNADSGSDDGDDDADAEDTDTEEEDSGIDFSALPNYGYTDGTYTGTGYGYGGDIVLTVTVEGGQIVSIEVVSADGETYAYWIQAVTLTDTIILAQTWEVDAVSGATFSSEGIMEAVQNALADAIAGDDDDSSESDDNSSEGDTDDGADDDSSSDDGSSDTETPDEDTENDDGTDFDGDADDSTDNDASDDDTEDGSTADDDTPDDSDSSGGPVTTVETETCTVTGTATVYPDEYEDFDAYEITVAITLQKTVTTVTDGSTVTITTETEIIDAEYSSDTDSTNLRYLSRAWTKMIDSLLAGEEADAVSGATCSSTGIQTAWDEALSGVTLGTVTETTETDESDEEEEEDTEPVTTEEVYTVQYSYTVTITPDEDEDFDAYEAVITITVQTTVVTVTDGNSVTVTTTNEIIDTAYESDTDSTNLRYLSRAWTKMIDSLTAMEEVDAVSGATCSSNAILEAWEQFYSEVTLGTETTEYETASSYAVQSSAVIYANIPEPIDPEEECLTDSDDAEEESDKEQDKKTGETARKEEDEE